MLSRGQRKQNQYQLVLGKEQNLKQMKVMMIMPKRKKIGPAPVGVMVKLKQRKGSKKSKAEGLNASDEPSQGSNAQAQTKTTSKVPKPKRSIAPDHAGTLQPKEIIVEIYLWNGDEERANDNGSSGDGGKDWRIDKKRKKDTEWGEGLKDLYKHGNRQGKKTSQKQGII
ncbi:MAG: hypothetical protein EZS28_046283 [Streblomastix strix]|uniref:Uncharacterized protein n=1 Tax=Streblomastix strix TaxID=222440 RepID=A0A5J4TKZ4_9EUKA|nr:MAG: hypothetical protein EZS28_046283 [Streblomastix strix]